MNISSASSITSLQKKEEPKKNPLPLLAIDNAFKKLSSGTQMYIEKYGRGEPLQDGDVVTVHYEGWLAKDYTKFDSSRDKRKTL